MRPEQKHEWRRRQRIDERLRVVQPRANWILELHPPHERERGRRADAIDLAPLQEDSLGTAAEFLPDAREILALEREVEVGRQALREAVIGRLVAFEALRLTRQVERRGERHQDD